MLRTTMTKRVAIVSNERACLQALETGFRGLGLETESLENGFRAACALLFSWGDDVPDLIVVDLDIWPHDGLGICEQIIRQDQPHLVPMIILADRLDVQSRRRCEDLGVHYVRKSNDLWPRLQPLICELLDLESAAASNDSDEDTTVMPEPPATAETAGGHARVLCIDDDYLFTEVIQRRLAPHGIEVSRAFTGLHGYWKALKERPHLILTDYAMPQGDANDLLQRLQRHSLTSQIPVIVLTACDVGRRPGTSDATLAQQLYQHGARSVLTKPIDHRTLLTELQRHLVIGAQPTTCPQPVLS